MLSSIIKWIFVWLFAAGLVASLGSIFSSLRVMAMLEYVGDTIGWRETFSMVFYDALHFGTLYFIFIAIGLLIAFCVGTVLLRLIKKHSHTLYPVIVFTVAGAVSMSVMLWAMETVFFGTQLVAGARDGAGFALQIIAGIIGGLVFAYLTKPKPPKSI